MITQVYLNPIKSIRTPRINKKKILDFFNNASGKTIHEFRLNFYDKFLEKRENCIENQVDKIYKEKKLDKDLI